MKSTASFVRSLVPVLLLGCAAACDGQRIRLGDGFLDAGSLVVEVSASALSSAAPLTTETVVPSASASIEATASSSASASNSNTPPACRPGTVRADEVLWIGDSWVEIPGIQRTRVRDLARGSGAIRADEDYVDLAASASNLSTIVGQYAMRQAGAVKVRVLIMDGGTWDTLIAKGSAASVSRVASGFEDFLAKVAMDGSVQHIIYYLPPELPTIMGVAELRPSLQKSCAESDVPCHFIDLQPLWANHPEYTAADGIQASETGAAVIADAIWGVMQAECIAQ